VKHRSTIPGGTCEFDLPDYTHWLNQPDEIRGADFAHWLAVIRPLGDAASELLWMTREQGKSRPEVAPGGVFHLTLDRDVPAQMVRIALPAGTDIYPEISGSHYRCSVRFLVWQDASTRRSRPPRTCGHADDLYLSVKTVTCPTCQRPVEWSAASPFRPFCSERCKLVDLGAWVSEQRAIPARSCRS